CGSGASSTYRCFRLRFVVPASGVVLEFLADERLVTGEARQVVVDGREVVVVPELQVQAEQLAQQGLAFWSGLLAQVALRERRPAGLPVVLESSANGVDASCRAQWQGIVLQVLVRPHGCTPVGRPIPSTGYGGFALTGLLRLQSGNPSCRQLRL